MKDFQAKALVKALVHNQKTGVDENGYVVITQSNPVVLAAICQYVPISDVIHATFGRSREFACFLREWADCLDPNAGMRS